MAFPDPRIAVWQQIKDRLSDAFTEAPYPLQSYNYPEKENYAGDYLSVRADKDEQLTQQRAAEALASKWSQPPPEPDTQVRPPFTGSTNDQAEQIGQAFRQKYGTGPHQKTDEISKISPEDLHRFNRIRKFIMDPT